MAVDLEVLAKAAKNLAEVLEKAAAPVYPTPPNWGNVPAPTMYRLRRGSNLGGQHPEIAEGKPDLKPYRTTFYHDFDQSHAEGLLGYGEPYDHPAYTPYANDEWSKDFSSVRRYFPDAKSRDEYANWVTKYGSR